MTISIESADPARRYANLLPVVEELLAAGNHQLDGGFVLNPDGWKCRLAWPIDFNLIRSRFTLPSNIELSAEFDSVLDRRSWCVIEGPGARQ